VSVHFALLTPILLEQFEVFLPELGLLLGVFADEQTLLAISFHSHLVLSQFDGLVNIKFENLDEAAVSNHLRGLKV